MKLKTVRDTSVFLKNSLIGIYPNNEINQLSSIIFEHVLNYSKIDIHLNQNTLITNDIFQQFEFIAEQLKKFKPIQYIIGKTTFYELNFIINENVLIPRQETEELVHWIIDDWKKKPCKILDIGTGSGCIAVSLAKNLPESSVDASDKSIEALEVAGKNAELNDCSINFIEFDILTESNKNQLPVYDIIVSNPPYVCKSEKKLMNKNVLEYEPSEALFVNDNDPLIFYKSIARFIRESLKPGGMLYVEINEKFGVEVINLFNQLKYTNIELRIDINGKDRMVKAVKEL